MCPVTITLSSTDLIISSIANLLDIQFKKNQKNLPLCLWFSFVQRHFELLFVSSDVYLYVHAHIVVFNVLDFLLWEMETLFSYVFYLFNMNFSNFGFIHFVLYIYVNIHSWGLEWSTIILFIQMFSFPWYQ